MAKTETDIHDQMLDWTRRCYMHIHHRFPVVFVRGEGCRICDARGKR